MVALIRSLSLAKRAESDRDLGNPIVAHRSTLIGDPAGKMAPPRQKNVVGMNEGGRWLGR